MIWDYVLIVVMILWFVGGIYALISVVTGRGRHRRRNADGGDRGDRRR
ncbi:hypothetical protein ABLE94_06235 [Gordonia sp. VNK1]